MKKIVGFTEKNIDINKKCLPIAALYVLFDGKCSVFENAQELDVLSKAFSDNLASKKNPLYFDPIFLKNRYNRQEIETPYHFFRTDYYALFKYEIVELIKLGLLSDIHYKDDAYCVIVCARTRIDWDAHAFAVRRSGKRYFIYESHQKETTPQGRPIYDYQELICENETIFKKSINTLFRSYRPSYREMKLVAFIRPKP